MISGWPATPSFYDLLLRLCQGARWTGAGMAALLANDVDSRRGGSYGAILTSESFADPRAAQFLIVVHGNETRMRRVAPRGGITHGATRVG
jgi:hypothetical protein